MNLSAKTVMITLDFCLHHDTIRPEQWPHLANFHDLRDWHRARPIARVQWMHELNSTASFGLYLGNVLDLVPKIRPWSTQKASFFLLPSCWVPLIQKIHLACWTRFSAGLQVRLRRPNGLHTKGNATSCKNFLTTHTPLSVNLAHPIS